MTISKLADKAILLLKKEKEKNNLEYEQKMAILYPNRKIKSGHNTSKTPSISEMATMLKDMRSGEFWTSDKYRPDNDNETKV
jgi:3-dehydroquinate dehydratase